MADDPWTFGWTQLLTLGGQLLTISGLGLTAYLGFRGLRTFERWKREKIEEKCIDVAIDALAAAYKSKFVFEYIRSPLVRAHEYQDLPVANQSLGAGPHAALKRIERNNDFFDHVWELQPRFMAIFGAETEETFRLLHEARRDIEIACELVDWMGKPETQEDRKLWVSARQDIFSSNGASAKDGDRVGKKLEDFRSKIEALCRPFVDRELRSERTPARSDIG